MKKQTQPAIAAMPAGHGQRNGVGDSDAVDVSSTCLSAVMQGGSTGIACRAVCAA